MIRLGYEIGSGRAVDIPADRHIAISGQTQRSGKTTTLEALVQRSPKGTRAVAFVTKRAEGSFRSARTIPPYFRDSADWEFVSSILEAMLGEKLKLHRSKIMDACRDAEGLADVQRYVREHLHGVKAKLKCTCGLHVQGKEGWLSERAGFSSKADRRRMAKCSIVRDADKWQIKPATGFVGSILTELESYLEKVVPQIERLPYTKELDLKPGLSVMDLSEYSTELQSLVIRSVLEWVYERERNTIVIIPEAWEFIPQNRRSPVLLAAEELIRKGAAAGNFVWLDSQDLQGVHKNILGSCTVSILGVQSEENRVKKTLAALPVRFGRNASEIMTLTRGQFFAAWDNEVRKVYVQPFWISDVHAAAIARGEEDVASAEKIWREQKRSRSTDAEETVGTSGESPDVARGADGAPVAAGIHGAQPAIGAGSGAFERGSGWPEWQPATEGDDDVTTQAELQTLRSELRAELAGYAFVINEMKSLLSDADIDRVYAKAKAKGYFAAGAPLRDYDEVDPAAQGALAKPAAAPVAEIVHAGGNNGAAQVDGESSLGRNGKLPYITDAFVDEIRRRLLASPSTAVALEAIRPELKIAVRRQVIDLDAGTVKGSLARLIHAKFFDTPRAHGAILGELKRRGWIDGSSKGGSIILNPLNDLAKIGFLTIEESGYQAVASMQITTKEA